MKVGPLNVVLLKVLNMSLLLVNLVVLVLIACEKQGTEVVNLLTAPRQGTSCPQSDGKIPMDHGWESRRVVFCLLVEDNIHIKASFPNITD